MATELNIDTHERQWKTDAEFAAGTVTYAGRSEGWHKNPLSKVFGRFATWKELLAAASADFTVVKKQLDFLGIPVNAWGTFRIDRQLQEALNAAVRANASPEDILKIRQKAIFLASVSATYQTIQHTEGFETLDTFVGEKDGAHYETMGTLDLGRIVWGQVDPNVKIRVGDDESDVLLTFQTSHDGSKSFEIYETIYRYVCRNTFKAGQLKKLANALKVRHTKNAGKKIDSLKAEIAEVQAVALTTQEQLNFLAKKRVTREGLDNILDRLFPKTVDAETGLERSTKHRDNVLEDVLAIYESNDGNAFPEQRGTLYNLFNAVTNYTDHQRGKDLIARAESGQFGSGSRLKSDALEVITLAAKDAPEVLQRGGGTLEYSPELFTK